MIIRSSSEVLSDLRSHRCNIYLNISSLLIQLLIPWEGNEGWRYCWKDIYYSHRQLIDCGWMGACHVHLEALLGAPICLSMSPRLYISQQHDFFQLTFVHNSQASTVTADHSRVSKWWIDSTLYRSTEHLVILHLLCISSVRVTEVSGDRKDVGRKTYFDPSFMGKFPLATIEWISTTVRQTQLVHAASMETTRVLWWKTFHRSVCGSLLRPPFVGLPVGSFLLKTVRLSEWCGERPLMLLPCLTP